MEPELSSTAAFITGALARREKAATSALIIAARSADAASRAASRHLPPARPSLNARGQNSAQWNMRESVLLRLAHGDCGSVTAEMVGEAYAQGDPVAAETLRETVELLSLWLGNMIDLLEPDVIILGGGVADLMRPFLGEIRDLLPGCCVNRRCQEIPLLPAFYGGDAGIAGGAALGSRSAFCAQAASCDHPERHALNRAQATTLWLDEREFRARSRVHQVTISDSLVISPSTIRQIPKGLLSRSSSGRVDSGNP